MLGVPQGSAGQQAQEMVPDGVRGRERAAHRRRARSSRDLDEDLDEDVPIAGDKKDAKRQVAELIAQIPGLRPIDCGRARDGAADRGPHAAPDLGERRHKTHAGIKFAGSEPRW